MICRDGTSEHPKKREDQGNLNTAAATMSPPPQIRGDVGKVIHAILLQMLIAVALQGHPFAQTSHEIKAA